MRSLVCVLALAASPAMADEGWLFDFGGRGSVAQPGAVVVGSRDHYSVDKGYGLVVGEALAERSGTGVLATYFGYSYTAISDILATHPNGTDATLDDTEDPDGALRIDAVGNADGFGFAVDLPDGRYDVTVWLGEVSESFYFMDVEAEGVLQVSNVHAATDIGRTIGNTLEFGGSTRRTFVVDVTDGQLELKFGSLDAEAGPWLETYQGKAYVGASADIDMVDKEVHRAYDGVFVQGIEVMPHEESPVWMDEDGMLVADIAELDGVVDAFNAGEFESAAEMALAMGTEWPLETAQALLWIAGRPEVDNVAELMTAANAAAQYAVSRDPESGLTARVARDVWDIHVAYETMALIGYGQGSASGRHMHGTALLASYGSDHPFYTKRLIRTARSWCGLDPRGNMGYLMAMYLLEEVAVTHPDNKYVRLFIDREWGEPDWLLPLPELDESAPEWAAKIHQSNALFTAFVQWWIDNRLNEFGELGGGYSDDVEIIIPFMEYVMLVVDDEDPILEKGLRAFLDSVWGAHDGIDPETGFSNLFADAEHSAELSADGYSLITPLYYGEPLYFERNLKTASRFTQVWTDFAGGYRHFKGSSFDGNVIKGKAGSTGMDESINMRALFNAAWVLWYSDHPVLEEALIEYADSLAALAMRSDNGKPEGIIGAPLEFASDTIGGPGGVWYGSKTASNGVWYPFPKYAAYPHNFLATMYLRTGDEAYYEPFKLEAELAVAGMQANGGTAGSANWAGDQVANDLGAAAVELARVTGRDDFDALFELLDEQASSGWVRNSLLLDPTNEQKLLDAVSKPVDLYTAQWPYWTTEALMTDRVAAGGELNAISAMIGTSAYSNFQGMASTAVTYKAAHRDFATLVTTTTDKALTLKMYGFAEDTMDLGVRAWRLPVGATYTVSWGPDANDDGEMDTVSAQFNWTLEHRGDPVWVSLPPAESTVLSIEWVEDGAETGLRPDLAIGLEDIVSAAGGVDVTVHNIGAAASSPARLTLYDGPPWLGQVIDETDVPSIEAPLDYVAKTVSLRMDGVGSGCHSVWAEVVSDDVEITQSNNAFSATPASCGNAPKAVGQDTSGAGGAVVSLDASASSDPDGDALFAHWEQVAGPALAVEDSGALVATATLPEVTEPTLAVFELSVSDGVYESVDRVFIAIDVSDGSVDPQPGVEPGGPASNCGCASGPSKTGGLAWLCMALLGALGWRRRQGGAAL